MHAEGWFLTSPGKPLEHRGFELREPASDEVIVKVDACGVCHTDLAYADGSVAPAHALPLVLGHEIVGEVVRAGKRYDELVGAYSARARRLAVRRLRVLSQGER